MNLNIFTMGGYGLYVWSAFLFAFLVCLVLFLKTRKSLLKLEKDYKEEVKKLSAEQVETLSKAKISRDILTSQSKVK